MMLCIIDGRYDVRLEADFESLNLCGKPLCFYAIDAVLAARFYSPVVFITESEYLLKLINEHYQGQVQTKQQMPSNVAKTYCIVSARAVMLTGAILQSACNEVQPGTCLISATSVFSASCKGVSLLGENVMVPVNAFFFCNSEANITRQYLLTDGSELCVNTKKDFELALILIKKRENASLLKQNILKRIQQKEGILSNRGCQKEGITLIGHSQFDLWDIQMIAGRQVRNCGISGISDFEYVQYILKPQMLDCTGELFVVIGGTNDIVYSVSEQQIAESLNQIFQYIQAKNDAPIIFIEVLPVNGRLDRDNKKIVALNKYLRNALSGITFMSADEFCDDFGNLKIEYTNDGLHLNKSGYIRFYELLDKKINYVMRT